MNPNIPIDNEETVKRCTYNDRTFYCRSTAGDCCVCWYNRTVCFDGISKEDDDERN